MNYALRIVIVLGFVMLSMSGSILAQVPQGRVNTPITDVTVSSTVATLIDGKNDARTALSCTNNDSTIHVRWGSSAVTTTAGEQLRAAASIEITSTDAVYMIAESSSVAVSCTKETVR